MGLSVAVGTQGELVFARGYGLAEVEHGAEVDTETCFRIGSITKQFTAVGVCKLAEDGELFYDDDFTQYVPSFPTQGRTVTIRHLLTHTSASRATRPRERSGSAPSARADARGAARRRRGPALRLRTRARYNYSNTGYYLLGMVIENVAEESYADHMQRVFFEPLGLERTRYGSNRDLIENRAQGYQVIDGALANDDLIGMSQPGAAGALLSTASDLVRWKLALVSGEIVDPATYVEMTLPTCSRTPASRPTASGSRSRP